MNQTEIAVLYDKLYRIIKTLRDPGGCPWDREQTVETLLPNVVEEAYELLEAVHLHDLDNVKEELGDLYLLVTMMAYMHEQTDSFSVADVLRAVNEKLIRRHPHVFGEKQELTADETIAQWEKIKMDGEGKKPRESIFDGIPQALPPLEKSFKIQKKVSRVGFDWKTHQGVVEKIHEEVDELAEAVKLLEKKESSSAALEEELGDLLFSVINLGRFLGLDPGAALHKTNAKFERRFRYLEKRLKEEGLAVSEENNGLMERYWEESKRQP